MNDKKYCPFKMAHSIAAPVMATCTWYCEEGDCAWWNADLEMCCAAVDAYLKAEEHAKAQEFGTKEWREQAQAVDGEFEMADRRIMEREG